MALETFGQTTEKKPFFKQDFKRTQFLDLSSTAVIRVLSNDRLVVYTHWINRTPIVCLGDECPVCSSNKILRMQYPETFKEESKYSPRRTTKLVNVLDKTPTRVCPNCDAENRAGSSAGTASACKKCGQILTGDAQPLRKVKVLSRGVELFDDLDTIYNAVLDEKGEKVGLTKFDITLAVSSGAKKAPTPIPGAVGEEEVVNPEDLYNLEDATIKLEVEEILDFQRGVSLRDIFAARRASKEKAEVPGSAEIISPETEQSIQDEVDKLFQVNK